MTEESPRPVAAPSDDLTYAKRLETDKADETLERPAAGAPAAPPTTVAAHPAAAHPPAGPPTTTANPAAHPAAPAHGTAAVKPQASPPTRVVRGAPPPGSGNFTIQVGAFKDKGSADSVVARLKAKGFAAYVMAPEGEGLFNVRVGNFAGRADAERIQARLRDEEKFKPFIVKP